MEFEQQSQNAKTTFVKTTDGGLGTSYLWREEYVKHKWKSEGVTDGESRYNEKDKLGCLKWDDLERDMNEVDEMNQTKSVNLFSQLHKRTVHLLG